MVAFWTQLWLKYRAILIQDIIHIRRPDMQSIDSVMHVTANRSASVCALAMYYNPSLFKQSITLKLPLYYTGETDAVLLEWNGAGAMRRMTLARDYSIVVNVTLGPREIGFSVAHRLSSQREKKEAVPISWKSDDEATEPWQSGNACKRSEHGSPTCTGSTGRDLPPHVLCESTVRVICSRGNCLMTPTAVESHVGWSSCLTSCFTSSLLSFLFSLSLFSTSPPRSSSTSPPPFSTFLHPLDSI